MENKIKAEIISHSKRRNTGEEIITYKLTFPRIILSEVNTYKMMEKNTSSCLSGDTPIMLYNIERKFLFQRPIRLIYQDFVNNEIDYGIISYDEDKKRFFLNEIKTVFNTGVKEVFGLGNEFLNYLECTKEHRLLTNNGWVTTEQFIQNEKENEYQVLYELYESFKILNINSEKKYLQWRDVSEKLATKTTLHILKVRNEGKRETYDIEVKGEYHNFLANGIIVHNSRAIPFEKMVEVVEKEPFVPIAYQLQHRGMQGTEYLTDPKLIEHKNNAWLTARNEAVFFAKTLVGGIRDVEEQKRSEEQFNFSDKFIPNTSLSKNYGNRIIELWTWVCQLITGTRESFEHLFKQRCPIYPGGCKSWKELCDLDSNYSMEASILEKLQVNKGQAEIHFMDLAEKMYDALNESKPIIMGENDWHIPFSDRPEFTPEMSLKDKIMLSCAMTARVSYTTIEDNETLTLEKARKIYEKCVEQGHFSVVSHVAKCMTNKEYRSWYKGFIEMKEYVDDFNETKRFFEANDFLNAQGYNKNLKGFISLRQYVEDEMNLNDI